VRNGDLRTVGLVATRSAEKNQRIRPKSTLDEMVKTCSDIGGVGIVIAHSGTMIGVMLDESEPGFYEKHRALLESAVMRGTARIGYQSRRWLIVVPGSHYRDSSTSWARCTEFDPRTGQLGRRKRLCVDAGDVGDAELVTRTDQLDRCAQRRRGRPARGGRPEAAVRQREVHQGSPDEDSRRPDAEIEVAAALTHEHIKTLQSEQASRPQAREPGGDNEYIRAFHVGPSCDQNQSKAVVATTLPMNLHRSFASPPAMNWNPADWQY
jgi:hypothetical protein